MVTKSWRYDYNYLTWGGCAWLRVSLPCDATTKLWTLPNARYAPCCQVYPTFGIAPPYHMAERFHS